MFSRVCRLSVGCQDRGRVQHVNVAGRAQGRWIGSDTEGSCTAENRVGGASTLPAAPFLSSMTIRLTCAVGHHGSVVAVHLAGRHGVAPTVGSNGNVDVAHSHKLVAALQIKFR